MLKIKIRTDETAVDPTPLSGDRPIDDIHLFRMTLGDHHLEHEVLRLFDRQIELLLARMENAEADAVATLAHTLKGSARGVGAWDVARSAEAVEAAVAQGAGVPEACARLAVATAAVREAIAEILNENRHLR
jgi:HPt (histidine-containing phosphotransfer) domain-containing protein